MEETLEAPQIGERLDRSMKTKIRQSDKDENLFTFIISKEEEDRHGSIVMVDGVDVSHFKRNPVVLFNHNYDRVIGTASNVRVVGDTLQADMRFAETEFAQEIKGQVERGEIRATSIGFIVNEWSLDEENDTWKIMRSELLEFSIVTVPSNRSALIMRDAEVKSLRETVDKLAATVEKLGSTVVNLATPKIDGQSIIKAVNRNDQPDQLATNETSARENADELAETDDPVPGEGDQPEEDRSHDTEGEIPHSKSNTLTLDQALRLAREVVDRRLGKK